MSSKEEKAIRAIGNMARDMSESKRNAFNERDIHLRQGDHDKARIAEDVGIIYSEVGHLLDNLRNELIAIFQIN